VDLSIVIVNWNTRDLLRDCLASLEAACFGLDYEVLVVDNDSADGSAEMVRAEFPSYQLIESGGNLGFSKGNNLALPRTSGDFVLLLNPDTVAEPGSLYSLVEFARTKPRLAAVTPLLTDAEGQPTITYGYFPRERDHWLGFLDPTRRLRFAGLQHRVVRVPEPEDYSEQVEYIAGACFLMPRPALEEIGLLDERFFMYFEETDWCLRAHRAGWEIWFHAGARVAHLEGRAAAKVNLFAIRQFQKSYRLFVAKNYGEQAVLGFRVAQWFEYSFKALMRSLAVGGDEEANKVLAATYRERARLQLRPQIDVQPPGTTEKSEPSDKEP
jgi:N-acetylglucosaminyl-diphospho-decaprenol L-rhamnosyltransferase